MTSGIHAARRISPTIGARHKVTVPVGDVPIPSVDLSAPFNVESSDTNSRIVRPP